MSNNLFIAYDLDAPGQNYDAVRDAIKSLGQWHQFQLSLFYVNTYHSAAEAYEIVLASMDGNDKLCVVDAKLAIVNNADKPLLDAINSLWHTA